MLNGRNRKWEMEKLGHSWVMGPTGWFGPTGCSHMSAQRAQSGELWWGKRERCCSMSESGESRGSLLPPGRKGRDNPRGEFPEAGLRPLPPSVWASSCAGIQLCGQSDVQGSSCAGSYLCMVPAVSLCSSTSDAQSPAVWGSSCTQSPARQGSNCDLLQLWVVAQLCPLPAVPSPSRALLQLCTVLAVCESSWPCLQLFEALPCTAPSV